MQVLRFLLFPFAVCYDLITRVRNLAFNYGVLPSKYYDIPVIAIGNLSTGGSGKTPMVEYLIRECAGKRVAVLSRGYGRKTKGFIELNADHTTNEVGDEPLQIKLKFPEIIVAVCEKRADGIDRLLKDHDLDVVLLDDAYQHRYVKASQYILLTDYSKPYFKDYVLPTGNLREARIGANRASHIVVTKCPENIDQETKRNYLKAISPKAHQKVYFSSISYDKTIRGRDTFMKLQDLPNEFTVVTGIANPSTFIDFLSNYGTLNHLKFSDHHQFTNADLDIIRNSKLVITTEKDYVRLLPYRLDNCYFLPIRTTFIDDAIKL